MHDDGGDRIRNDRDHDLRTRSDHRDHDDHGRGSRRCSRLHDGDGVLPLHELLLRSRDPTQERSRD